MSRLTDNGRRRFFGMLAGAFALPLLGAVQMACGSGKKRVLPEKMTFHLGDPVYAPLAGVGGAAYAEVAGLRRPLILQRVSQTTVTAMTSECTHASCRLSLPRGGEIACPCHASRFSTEGDVLAGPATAALKRFPAILSGNRVTVEFS